MNTPRAIRTILVGVDERPRSAETLYAGWRLAGALDAELRIVHAVDTPPGKLTGFAVADDDRRTDADSLRDSVRGLGNLEPGLARTDDGRGLVDRCLTLVPGKSGDVLLEEALRAGADLLVIGPHERNPIGEFGSTVRDVLARAEVPVWVQTGPFTPIERVLVCLDLSESDDAVLAAAGDLARRFGASVELMHVFVEPAVAHHVPVEASGAGPSTAELDRERARTALGRRVGELARLGLRASAALESGVPVEAIEFHASDADLVVCGRGERSELGRWLLGSVARGVVANTDAPVVVVPRGWGG